MSLMPLNHPSSVLYFSNFYFVLLHNIKYNSNEFWLCFMNLNLFSLSMLCSLFYSNYFMSNFWDKACFRIKLNTTSAVDCFPDIPSLNHVVPWCSICPQNKQGCPIILFFALSSTTLSFPTISLALSQNHVEDSRTLFTIYFFHLWMQCKDSTLFVDIRNFCSSL